MLLNEAKKVLNKNGYDMFMSLDEARYILKNNGYILTEADEENTEKPEENNDSKDSDENGEEVEELVNDLTDVKDYDAFVKTLQGLNPEQTKLLRKLVGNGEYSNNVKVKKVTIKVAALHPTQSEIDVNNSLIFPINKAPNGKPTAVDILNGKEAFVINKNPIIIYKYSGDGKYYIIDGHHRWSQVFLINPKAKMEAYLYTSPEEGEAPVDFLRDFQLVIKAVHGKVQVATANHDYNVYKLSPEAIVKYVEQNMTDEALDVWKTYKTKNGTNPFTTKKAVAEYLAKNSKLLHDNNKPAEGAPDREIMPQTDQQSLNVAKKGMFDI